MYPEFLPLQSVGVMRFLPTTAPPLSTVEKLKFTRGKRIGRKNAPLLHLPFAFTEICRWDAFGAVGALDRSFLRPSELAGKGKEELWRLCQRRRDCYCVVEHCIGGDRLHQRGL